MKKIFLTFTVSILAALFAGCNDSSNTHFEGCWQESESNIIFEVLKSDQSYIIRNQNGDLTAQINSDKKLCGTNSLNMEYCMSVKGDSAYYEFSGIVTGYKRISKAEYDKIFATLPKATFSEKPAETEDKVESPAATENEGSAPEEAPATEVVD